MNIESPKASTQVIAYLTELLGFYINDDRVDDVKALNLLLSNLQSN